MKLYRKRLIPEEIVELKNDIMIYQDEERIITKWQVIRPRDDFSHGSSCYFLKEGIKVSQFLREDESLKCWYCDIIKYEKMEDGEGYICVDLLADVVILEDGTVQVVDLDELAEAFEQNLITKEDLSFALRRLNALLDKIYNGEFDKRICQYFEL